MSKDSRDTQFAEFARQLWIELIYASPSKVVGNSLVRVPPLREDAEKIISQRAYDLVEHAVGYCLEYLHECGIETSGQMNSRIQPAIPDLTSLPGEPE